MSLQYRWTKIKTAETESTFIIPVSTIETSSADILKLGAHGGTETVLLSVSKGIF